jgi:hypothetical protein
MHFEYEITADEFSASQVLYYKLSTRRRPVYKSSVFWILLGLWFVVVAWNEHSLNWASAVLVPTGAWWIYVGIVGLFPTWYFRNHYKNAERWGEHFSVDANETGFEVVGNLCSWRIKWEGVKLKGEDKKVFMFYSANTVFSFGKKYLSEEQQQELRKLSGMNA